MRTMETNLSEMRIKYITCIIEENESENVVCELAAILSRPQRVNGATPSAGTVLTTNLNSI